MSVIVRNGSRHTVASEANIEVFPNGLPVGTYGIKFDPSQHIFYLERIDDFKLPPRLYGNIMGRADRVLNTFRDRPAQTGTLLNGTKGSGKTLLAKAISIQGAKLGIPTVVINEPHVGELFFDTIQGLGEAIVLFDEFEKVYDWNKQEDILTLLDGVFSSRKLWIMTTNDQTRVMSMLSNRPGRIFYRFNYSYMDRDVIIEFVEHNLKNKEHAKSILDYTAIFNFFNFDMLSALVEEMNRYNEPLDEVLKWINIIPETRADETFSATLTIGSWSSVFDKNIKSYDPTRFTWDFYPDEDILEAIGDSALGLVTAFHYSEAHKSPENKAYTEAYYKAYPKDRPNFMSVGGYDGMRLIAEVLKKTNGNTDADKFVEAAKGMKWVSPRGPISIDPETRDIVQNIYIRKVEKINGKLQNVEFDHVADFKDPGKQ